MMPTQVEAIGPEGSLDLVSVSLTDFLAMELPPRRQLLSPWLPERGLAMVYAPRGVGKTYFALGVAHAVATGGEFLGWQAENPCGVLFVDGEMSAPDLQERLKGILPNEQARDIPLKILTPDLLSTGMIDLSRRNDQEMLNPLLTDVGLVIVDNISSLCRGGRENGSESWVPVQQWALNLRARGKSVLFIHHAGKAGSQRGTSRREDVLDTVIALRRPEEYSPEQGAVFEVHFEKSRGFHGQEARPFLASLSIGDDSWQTWEVGAVEGSTFDRVVALAGVGMSQSEIAEDLEVSRPTVSRHLRRAREEGLL